MAFQAVEQVKKAEAEAAEMVAKAEQDAKAKIAKAHTDGNALKEKMAKVIVLYCRYCFRQNILYMFNLWKGVNCKWFSKKLKKS